MQKYQHRIGEAVCRGRLATMMQVYNQNILWNDFEVLSLAFSDMWLRKCKFSPNCRLRDVQAYVFLA